MKNIKKKLDYKNYIYISLSTIFNVKMNLTIIYFHITYHKKTYKYHLSVPVTDNLIDICYRLTYNLPKRKLVKILWNKEDIQCINQNIN